MTVKILFVGRGVVSTLYGWAFARAGHEVAFLVRPGRSREIGGEVELDLLDARAQKGSVPLVDRFEARCVEEVAVAEDFDLVVLAARPEQMRSGAEQLSKAGRPRLGVLFFNNFWGEPGELSNLFEPGAALWAFPLAGGAFEGKRKLVGAVQGRIQLEAGDNATAELRAEVARLFASAGIEARTPSDFRAWLWLHYVVTAAMIAEAVRFGEGAAGVVESASRSAEAARLAKEMMRVVYARGVDPKVEREESTLGRIPGFFAGLVIKAVANRSPAMRRMMSGGGEPRFLALLPLDVLAEARRLGVPCPRLEALEGPLSSLAGKAGETRPANAVHRRSGSTRG
jgi:2-dehydropantoate 2-reductase